MLVKFFLPLVSHFPRWSPYICGRIILKPGAALESIFGGMFMPLSHAAFYGPTDALVQVIWASPSQRRGIMRQANDLRRTRVIAMLHQGIATLRKMSMHALKFSPDVSLLITIVDRRTAPCSAQQSAGYTKLHFIASTSPDILALVGPWHTM